MQKTSPGEELDYSYQALKTIVENPEFQEVITELQSLPPIERVEAAFLQLTPEALAARGVSIPDELTITINASQKSNALDSSNASKVAKVQNTADDTGTPQVTADFCIWTLCWSPALA